MAWAGVDGRRISIAQFRKAVDNSNVKWVSLIVWHNTWRPTIDMWDNYPVKQRIKNLEHWYKVKQGWPSGPHIFNDGMINLFTPLKAKGTHSPSWNGISIGIENVGDFSTEDDDSGRGLEIKETCIAITAILCSKLGLNPYTAIKLHKEDPATTHKDCPGIDFAEDKEKMIQSVVEYMGHAGEHSHIDIENALKLPEEQIAPKVKIGIVTVDNLNFRNGSSVTSYVKGKLHTGIQITILNSAYNGKTKWLYVETPAGYKGWVAANYVKEK